MTDPDREATLAAAARLEQAMGNLTDQIHALRTYSQRSRRLIWGLVVSLLLDVLLSVAVAVIAVQANEATSTANQNRQTQIATCEAGNQSRALQLQLWTYVLDLSAQSPRDYPGKDQQLAQFRDYIARTFAPRDCSR